MDFFRSILSDDPDLEIPDTYEDDTGIGISGCIWSFGDLLMGVGIWVHLLLLHHRQWRMVAVTVVAAVKIPRPRCKKMEEDG